MAVARVAEDEVDVVLVDVTLTGELGSVHHSRAYVSDGGARLTVVVSGVSMHEQAVEMTELAAVSKLNKREANALPVLLLLVLEELVVVACLFLCFAATVAVTVTFGSGKCAEQKLKAGAYVDNRSSGE